MDGYIRALIYVHSKRLSELQDNQKYLIDIEIRFIEELESLLDYYHSNRKEVIKLEKM